MNLTEFSIRRPVAMGSLIIALAILGIQAYFSMGLELVPKFEVPYITIVTVYPGAGSLEVEQDVARPIENSVVSISGLKHVTSSCMENICQTLLEFELDVDVDIAATDVRQQIELIRNTLPADVEEPKILKYDINAQPIITLALTGDLPVDVLYDYAENELKDRLTVIAGVADASLTGGSAMKVQVELDREKLAARNLTAIAVIQTIQQGLKVVPSGNIRENGMEYSVKFDADFQTIRQLGDLQIAGSEAGRCRLRDLAQITLASGTTRQKSFIDGQPSIAVKVIKKADANAVRVTEDVRAAMGKLNRTLPGGMKLVWVSDSGVFIRATNLSAWINVFQGILLTAVVLFFFLYNFRALFVVGVTMPLTIIIGLFFINLMGYTLNSSTLIAIGMSVGILVTNSIVVLEAIIKRLRETGSAVEASRMGSKEVTIAVLASAGTNIVVLFPLAMLGGMVGRFITPLSVTMLIMTAVSLFISFTLTPLLCSQILKPAADSRRGHLALIESKWNKIMDSSTVRYQNLLKTMERNRFYAVILLIVVAGLFFISLAVAGRLGSSMVSSMDMGELIVKLEYPTSYELSETERRVREVENSLKSLPELKHMATTIGKVEGMIGQASEGVHLAQILLKFSDKTERSQSIYELIESVRDRLKDTPDQIGTVLMADAIGGSAADMELEISGYDLDTLDRSAIRIQNLANELTGFRDVDVTVRPGKPEIRIVPKRDVLNDLGLSPLTIGTILRANLAGIEAGSFKQSGRSYDIIVKLRENRGKDQIAEFQFPGISGHPVILSGLGSITQGVSPVQITRKDKQRIVKLYSSLSENLPLGTAVDLLGRAIDKKGDLPEGYAFEFAGMYEHLAQSNSEMGKAGLIAIILVYLMLAAILESFRQPVIILITIPLALIGVIWALLSTGESMGIFVMMGCVMMIGIVVNNAILIIDQLNFNRRKLPTHEAMIKAAGQRFRPIVMTTIAAILGMIPLALGSGIGAEIRTGVGIASVGGILVSGILTLVVLPILYDFFTRRNHPAKPVHDRM